MQLVKHLLSRFLGVHAPAHMENSAYDDTLGKLNLKLPEVPWLKVSGEHVSPNDRQICCRYIFQVM